MSWFDAILNSSLSTMILALVCIGLIAYGKYAIFPKLQELEDTKAELTILRQEKDVLFSECSTAILAVNEKMDKGLSHGSPQLNADFNAQFVLLLDKVYKMESIISKHPNNLEMSMSDIIRNMQDLHRELNDLVKGYETIASTVLQISGRDDIFTGMERLK